MTRDTPEHAFLDECSRVAGLIDVVEEKQFIGDVPLLTEDETEEVLPEFLSLAGAQVVRVENTNDGLKLCTALWQIEIQDIALIDVERIARKLVDRLDRADFTYERGAVLNVQWQGGQKRQGDDGMWIVTQNWQALYTIAAA